MPKRETSNDVRSWPSNNVFCKNFKEIIRFYSIIGKKYNQLSASDADREIPTLGPTDNAGNEVNRRFRQHPLALGLGFLCLHQKPMIDSSYLSLVHDVLVLIELFQILL